MSTSLSKESSKLGYIGPKLRLALVAGLAVRQAKDYESRKAAFFRAISDDAELLWEFSAPFRDSAARGLLLAAAEKQRAEAGGGQTGGAREGQSARAPSINTGAGLAIAGIPNRDIAFLPDRAPDPTRVTVTKHTRARPGQATPAERARAAIGTLAKVSRGGLLEHKINGQPIGDMTAPDLRAWAASQRKQVRWVELVVSGIPDVGTIRSYRTPDEMEALMRDAKDAIHE